MEWPAYHKHDNSQIRSPEAKENGQAGSNADQLCRVRGETGRSIPDLPKWRSLNKYPSSPLRSHDHRKAAIKRLSECNSDRWSGVSRDHSQVPCEPKSTAHRKYCRVIKQRCSPSSQNGWC